LTTRVVDVAPTNNISFLEVLDLGTDFLDFTNSLVTKYLISVLVVLLLFH
jgi:hypothetical protein